MAEGGGKNDEDNPFSFKRFVKKQPNSPNGDSDDAENNSYQECQNLPDISAQMPHNHSIPVEESGADENPFSFKKFLKFDAKSQSGGLTTLDLAHDLPDFVQDHYSPDQNQGRSRHTPPDVQLPDFALELDNNSGQNKSNNSLLHNDGADVSSLSPLALDEPIGNPLRGGIGVPSLAAANNFSNNDDCDSDNDFVMPTIGPTAAIGLPDFLSDSALNQMTVNNGLELSDDDMDSAEEESGELKRLRKENRELKKQLNEAREFSERESKRVAGVLQEMEAIQKREAEETAALENMIQQVEANLQTTTQRAVSAEKTIVKVQQELKGAQGELSIVRCENERLRSVGGMDVMRERATYASQQLATAANNADATLKQLMSGVDTLKLMSSMLASIDKISEPESSAASSTSASSQSTKSRTSTPSSSASNS